MLIIHCRVRLTRRRQIVQVLTERGDLVFSSESMVECLTHVSDTGQKSVPIMDEDRTWWVQLISSCETDPPWITPWDIQNGPTIIGAG